MVMDPAESETKNDSAGEGQQQCTRPTTRNIYKIVVGTPEGNTI
jgi:hypothetical protein